MWGEEDAGSVETGVSPVTDALEGDIEEPDDMPDPSAIDINTMTTKDFLALSDWQWNTVLTQIVAELGACQRKRAELSPFYYEYKGMQEKERSLTSMKSAVQTLLRTTRETT